MICATNWSPVVQCAVLDTQIDICEPMPVVVVAQFANEQRENVEQIFAFWGQVARVAHLDPRGGVYIVGVVIGFETGELHLRHFWDVKREERSKGVVNVVSGDLTEAPK